MRKPSASERAWFLKEESELRTKLSFLAGENQRADVLACLSAHAPQTDRDAAKHIECIMILKMLT
jgi:hypothetical protein